MEETDRLCAQGVGEDHQRGGGRPWDLEPWHRRKGKEAHSKQRGDISGISRNLQGATATTQDGIRKADSLANPQDKDNAFTFFLLRREGNDFNEPHLGLYSHKGELLQVRPAHALNAAVSCHGSHRADVAQILAAVQIKGMVSRRCQEGGDDGRTGESYLHICQVR